MQVVTVHVDLDPADCILTFVVTECSGTGQVFLFSTLEIGHMYIKSKIYYIPLKLPLRAYNCSEIDRQSQQYLRSDMQTILAVFKTFSRWLIGIPLLGCEIFQYIG